MLGCLRCGFDSRHWHLKPGNINIDGTSKAKTEHKISLSRIAIYLICIPKRKIIELKKNIPKICERLNGLEKIWSFGEGIKKEWDF
ncbi:MAG: hypothetical protein ACI86M_003233 [Saprospiraceae bacterium]